MSERVEKHYQVGDLNVEIFGVSDGAEKSLASVARGLNLLQKSLQGIRDLPTATIGLQLRDFLNDIDTAMASIDSHKLGGLANLTNSLKGISTLTRLGKVDFNSVASGFEKLLPSISPFLDRLDKSQHSLSALSNTLSKASSKKLRNLSLLDENKKDNKKGLGFLGVAKLGSTIYLAKRLATIMGGLLKMGSDYTETLNLWQVAMRDNLNSATEFVNKMNDAYSVSKKTLMQAQATFKNMIGSLGDLSSETSYALSESITQMAMDYASLYNTTFETAINKFQSALAGQVRPIRSISGYDITEKTIHAFYESIGGTKTMRQLSRTEKQLLSIYVIFNQMNASGALGDMGKTINNFANQSRMMRENFEEIKSYTGVIVTHALETSQVMQYINAGLIFISTILEKIANKTGATKKNFVQDLFEDTNEAQQALEELNGSLLDFDKFRSLSSGKESPLSIDESLLKALGTYNSKLDEAENTAQKLADNWLKASGLFDENGVFNEERWKEIVDNAKAFGIALGALTSIKIIKSLSKLAGGFKGLSNVILGSAIFAFVKAYQAFKDGDYWAGILSTAVGVTLVGAFFLLKKAVMVDGVPYIELFGKIVNTNVSLISGAFVMLAYGVYTFIKNFDNLSTKAKIWIPIIAGLAGAITAVAAALTFMKGNWAGAISIGAMVAGAGLAVGSTAFAKGYANGGVPDKGTMFYAGESGAEIVYNMPSGQSGVANIQQIAQASYTGTSQALNNWWSKARNDIPQFKEVSKTGIYEVAKSEMKRRGEW